MSFFLLPLLLLATFARADRDHLADLFFENERLQHLHNCEVEIHVSRQPLECVLGTPGCQVFLMIYARDRNWGNEAEFSLDLADSALQEVGESVDSAFGGFVHRYWSAAGLHRYQRLDWGFREDGQLERLELVEGIVPEKPIQRRVRCSLDPYSPLFY